MAVTALGLLGSVVATSAGTTLAIPNATGAVIPAGTFIHITGAWDNTTSTTAPTVTSSTIGGATPTANHATAIGSGVTTSAGSGVWHLCQRVLTTADIAIGATICTLTSNQSAVKRAATAHGWSGATDTLRGTVTTGTSTTGTPSVASTGTALVTGDLVIGSVSHETNALPTGDSDTLNGSWSTITGVNTTGGSAVTNVGTAVQGKVVTATGAQTYNPNATQGDAIACIYSVTPAVDPLVTQAAYRFYDDGTETGSTALANQDTAPTVDTSGGDANLQLRTRLQETAGATFGVPATTDWQLQWKKGVGGDEVYGFANRSIGFGLYDTEPQIAQSFLGDGNRLTQATFFLNSQGGTPTGTISAALWAHDGGTFGGTGKPTGSPLATSTNSVTASTITLSLGVPATFTFAGSVTLTASTPYFIGLIATGAAVGSANGINMATDSTSPTHPGSAAWFNGTVWATVNAYDLCFEVSTWTNSGAPTLLDTVPATNYTSTGRALASDAALRVGQSFLGTGKKITRAGFYLDRNGSNGNVWAEVYAHTGTFGSGGLPTGSPLATSTTVLASSISSTISMVYFTFDGTFTLTNGTPYFIVLATDTTVPIGTGDLTVGNDNTPSHAGNGAVNFSGTWSNESAEPIFEVYGPGDTVVPYASTNLNGVVDRYDFGNGDTNQPIEATVTSRAQSFMGNGQALSAVDFALSKTNSPTGTVSAVLYAHDGGTFGSTGLPTGSALATSTNSVTASTLTFSPVVTTFTFNGTFTLTAGTPYFIGLLVAGPAASPNVVNFRTDNSSPTHTGNAARLSGTWATGTYDLCFEVRSVDSLTTNRLTGGSGTFVAGKSSGDGLVDDLSWSGNNYTELLYSLTLKQADLTAADTLQFRVLKNGATTDLTYTATPTVTIGSAGPTTWNVTADLPVTVGFGAGIAKTTGVGASLAVTSSFTAGATRTQPVAAANLQIGVSLAGAVDRTQPVAASLAVSVAGTAAVDQAATVAFTTPVTVTLAAAAVQAGAVNIAFTAPVTVTGLAAADRTATIAATLPVTVTGLAAATRTQFAAANSLAVTVTGLAAADRVTGIAATLPVTVTGLAAATRTQFVTANSLAVTVTGLAVTDRVTGITFTLPVTVTGVAAADRTQFVTVNTLTVTVTGLVTADRTAAIAFTLPVTMTGLAAAERTQFVTATSLTVTVGLAAAAVQTGAAAIAFTLPVTMSTSGAMALTALVAAAPLTVTVTTAGALLRTVGVTFTLPVTVTGLATADRTAGIAFTLPVTVTGTGAVTRTQLATVNTLTVTVTGLAAVDRTAGIAFTLPVTVTGVAAVGRTQLATVNALPVTVGLVAVAVPTGALAGAFALSVTATGTAGADRVAMVAATLPVTVSLTGALLRTVGVAAPLGVTVTGLVTADRVVAVTFTLPVTVTGLAAASPVGATGFTLPVTATISGAVLRTVGVTFTLPVTVTGLVAADRVATVAFTRTTTVAITGGFVTSIAVTRTITVGLSAGGIRTQPLATTLAVAASVVAGATREQPAGSTLALMAVLSAGAARSQFPTTSLVVTATTVFGGTVTHAYTVAFALVVTMSSTGTLPALVRDILVAAQVVRHWSSTVVGNDDRTGMVDAGRSASGMSSGRYTRAVSTREARVTE